MVEILVSKGTVGYIKLWYAMAFILYCFQLDKIVNILRTISVILVQFSSKQSSRIALPNKLQILNLILCNIRPIPLDVTQLLILWCSSVVLMCTYYRA